jgi:hypothetical protein
MQQPINKNKQQTAVEQFLQDLQDILPSSVDTETGIKLLMALKRAKEMEKQQKQKYLMAILDCKNLLKEINKTATVGQTQINIKIFELENILNAEQYYNETFNNKTMRNVHLITKEQEGSDVLHQYLYITSDEEIKVGDFGYNIVSKTIDKFTISLLSNKQYYKKIILTDNPDLIAEGVQAIDDEFLKWFVKNPSCEFVEVENEWEGNGTMFGFKMGNVSPDGTWRYQIILPQ